jgi:hypothetical protein
LSRASEPHKNVSCGHEWERAGGGRREGEKLQCSVSYSNYLSRELAREINIITSLSEKVMNLDLEQSAPLRRRGPRNESQENITMLPPPPPGLPARHPLQLMKRTAFICGTLYALHGK